MKIQVNRYHGGWITGTKYQANVFNDGILEKSFYGRTFRKAVSKAVAALVGDEPHGKRTHLYDSSGQVSLGTLEFTFTEDVNR